MSWEAATEGAESYIDAATAAVEMAAVATDMEEGADARVGVDTTLEVEEPEVQQGCRCAMMCICLPYPFEMGKNHIRLWRVWSSPQSRVTLFVRTGTCADCAGRTVSVKNCMFLPP